MTLNQAPDTDQLDDTFEDEASDFDELADGVTLAPLPTPGEPERAQAGISRAAIKRVIDKYIEVAAATPQHQGLIAATLGCRADAAEITAIVMGSARANLDTLSQVISLAEASASNPFEAVIRASALDRDDQKRVWQVLGLLGAAKGGLPAKEMTAATRLAQAAGALTPAQTADITAVRALGKK